MPWLGSLNGSSWKNDRPCGGVGSLEEQEGLREESRRQADTLLLIFVQGDGSASSVTMAALYVQTALGWGFWLCFCAQVLMTTKKLLTTDLEIAQSISNLLPAVSIWQAQLRS